MGKRVSSDDLFSLVPDPSDPLWCFLPRLLLPLQSLLLSASSHRPVSSHLLVGAKAVNPSERNNVLPFVISMLCVFSQKSLVPTVIINSQDYWPVKLVTSPKKLFEHAVLLEMPLNQATDLSWSFFLLLLSCLWFNLMTSLQLSYDDIALLSMKVFIERSMHPGLNCSCTLK